MQIYQGDDLVCPKCGCTEVNEETHLLNIRGYKVLMEPADGWWSECLNCNIWFSESGKICPSSNKRD